MTNECTIIQKAKWGPSLLLLARVGIFRSEPLSFSVDVSVGLAIDCPSLCGLSVEHERMALKPIDKIRTVMIYSHFVLDEKS